MTIFEEKQGFVMLEISYKNHRKHISWSRYNNLGWIRVAKPIFWEKMKFRKFSLFSRFSDFSGFFKICWFSKFSCPSSSFWSLKDWYQHVPIRLDTSKPSFYPLGVLVIMMTPSSGDMKPTIRVPLLNLPENLSGQKTPQVCIH